MNLEKSWILQLRCLPLSHRVKLISESSSVCTVEDQLAFLGLPYYHCYEFLRKPTLSIPRSFLGSNVEDARFCLQVDPFCSPCFAYSTTSFFQQLKQRS